MITQKKQLHLTHRALWEILSICMGYRLKMSVNEVMIFPADYGETGYYLCPRCHISLEREFMAFCDRCGQHLDWRNYTKARAIYPGS